MTLELWHIHLCFALLAFLLLPLRGRPLVIQAGTLLAILLLGFVPLDGLPLAIYLRTLTHDVSVVTLLALLWVSLVRMGLITPLPSVQRWTLIILFGVLGLFLYPAALGLGAFDPYRLGYSPRPMIVVFGLLALLMLYLGHRLAAAMLALATLAFGLGLLASENYWDYLIDPFVAIYCWFVLLAAGVRRVGAARSPVKN